MMMTHDGRTTFVVAMLVLLFCISWMMSLSSLLGIHFWDREHVLAILHDHPAEDPDLFNSTVFTEIAETYYSPRRYCYLLPHVLGAFLWWNLYFLQLIPRVRHAFDKKFHRCLGRVLMVTAFAQTTSGVGLALTSHSKIILIVSLFLAIAVSYCLVHAWKYAYHRDIPRHKYWVMRMVGYLQTIALQRFYILVLIVSLKMEWHGLYPDMTGASLEQANAVVLEMFDHSFLFAIFTAILVTEWYLASEQGMMMEPNTIYGGDVARTDKPINEGTSYNTTNMMVNEKQPLLITST